MSELNQTGDLTGQLAPVNPAPATPPVTSPVTQTAPFPQYQQTPVTPPQPEPNLIASYESRVRALMSEKDRARADYERAVNERLQLQQQYDQLQQNHQAALQGSAAAIEQALNRSKEYEAQVTKERAEKLKLKKAVENPDIAAYINALPDLTDEADLAARVDAIKAARDADLQKAREMLQATLPQTPPQQPNADPYGRMRAMYPDGNIPPASPARPSTSGPSGADSTQVMQANLAAALEKAQREGNYFEFGKLLEQQAEIAAVQARQQMGM